MNIYNPVAILRFRDLVTNPGETINNHKSIIEREGHVWWAWWSKFNEIVPSKILEFREDLREGKTEGLEMLLFDSGQKKLYLAIILEISTDGLKSPSPEPDKTPNYYNRQEFLMWFKIGHVEEIKSCSKEFLNALSYVKDNYFKDGEENYEEFYDKMVFSVGELAHQNRTIWIVRPRQSGDDSHEIKVYMPDDIAVKNINKSVIKIESHIAIWMSDFHFGSGHVFDQNQETRSAQNSMLTITLKRFLNTRELDKFSPIMILNGDFTTRGELDGFQKANEMLDFMKSTIQKNRNSYIIIPGNHDFSPKIAKSETELLRDHVNDEVSISGFRNFYKKFTEVEANKFMCVAKRFAINQNMIVEVVGLNSSVLQQSTGDNPTFMGHHFVGQEQLEYVSDNFGWNQSHTTIPFRIVVVHHNYIQTNYSEIIDNQKSYGTVLDGDRLITWCLKWDVKLILHGHQHQSFFTKIERPLSIYGSKDTTAMKSLYILGIGSVGAKSTDLPPGGSNEIGVLKFEKDKLVVEVYKFENKTASDECLWSASIPY